MSEQHPFTMPAHRREASVELGSAYRRESEASHGGFGGFRELLNDSPPPSRIERLNQEYDDIAGRRWIDERRPQRELPRRYLGDGFDFRRPVTSSAARGRDAREERQEQGETRVVDRTAERIDLDEDMEMPGMWRPEAYVPGQHLRDAPLVPFREERVDAEEAPARAQRLPRYDNAIIDLVSDDEDDNAPPPPQPQQIETERHRRPHYDPAHHPRTSALRHPRLVRQATPAPMEFLNDIEIVGSFTRQSTPATMATQGSTSVPAHSTIDLTAEDDEDGDLFITETRPARPGINNIRPDINNPNIGAREDDEVEEINYGAPLARLAGLVRDRAPAGYPGRLIRAFQHAQANDGNEVARTLPDLREHYQNHNHNQHLLETQRRRLQHERMARHRQQAAQRAQYQQPYVFGGPGPMDIMMDYNGVGFDMGLHGMQTPRPPTPTYEAPKEPEDGFTRTPAEEEILVCPNCGDELAVAGDGEKGQVWVVKACGHAYCGTCMANRNRKVNGKGKARATDPPPTLPFKSCVVDGCKRKVTARDVIHVYMSS